MQAIAAAGVDPPTRSLGFRDFGVPTRFRAIPWFVVML
jgi:hypothetical protein